MLDATIYASAAAIKHGVNWISDHGWQRLEAELESPAGPGAPDTGQSGRPASRPSIASLLLH